MQDTKTLPVDQLLIDIHPKTHKLVNWAERKEKTNRMAKAMQKVMEIDPSFRGRPFKLMECGSWLEFKAFKGSYEKTLHRANFCKYRLCPMCSWRRSLKIFGQTSQIMDVAEQEKYRFLFVTLTVRNVEGKFLKRTIDRLFDGYNRLLRQKKYKDIVHGSMRCLEVTHNVDPSDEWFDTYHPHIHAIFAVRSSYFSKKGRYIPQAQLIKDWRKAAKLSYDPTVDIRAIKKGDTGAIREVSKYSTKAGEILVDDEEMTTRAIWFLDNALAGRRLVSYAGAFRSIKSALNLDDAETGDLVNVDGDADLRQDVDYVIETYGWHAGYGQYTKTKKKYSKKHY